MPTYIAMLRGINVSGQKPLKMEALRVSFTKLKFANVQTYIQSGNVVFETKKTTNEKLAEAISKMIQKDFKYEVPVVVRTAAEMEKISKVNPFLKVRSVQMDRLYVTFLSKTPAAAAIKKMAAIKSDADQFEVIGREVYLYCPNGYGNTKLSNNLFEKMLAVQATTRNWKSVNTLLEMATLPAK